MECEKEPAIRYCKQCEDVYCLKCFATIHAKGKKSKHQWTNLDGTGGDAHEASVGDNDYGDVTGDDWQETWDENTQSYYWYVSVYPCPQKEAMERPVCKISPCYAEIVFMRSVKFVCVGVSGLNCA